MNTRIVLPQSFLKKFFAKARTAEPRLTQDISTTISKFYTELREKSQQFSGALVTQRAISTLFRLTEAHAKLHLKS